MFKIKNSLLALLVVSAFSISACENNNPVGPEDETETEGEVSLDKAYGGYTTSDEAPAFGDASMATDFGGSDIDPQDSYASDAAVSGALTSDADALPAYFVRITWGKLQGDSTATEFTDFSGYAEINKGTLAVLKLIRFEHRTDYLQLPRQSRLRVDFASQTKGHFDGLLLAVIDNDTAITDAGVLTISAGAYSNSFTFAELDSMELLETVDDLGNEISIISRSKMIEQFAGGFFTGRWIKDQPHGGHFRGRWIDSMGENAGYLRGIWGENRQGRRVMFGKYIKMGGRFGGLLAGRWGYREDSDRRGWLEGRWVDRNLQTHGKYRGVWKSGRPGDGRGFFHGRWRVTSGQADQS